MYFISRNYQSQSGAAGKAKIDCESAMEMVGFSNIGLRRTTIPSSFKGFFISLASVVLGLIRLPIGSTLCIQYPTKKYYRLMVWVARKKKCKVITIIHDLRSHRKQKMDIAEEIASLNKNHVIISHNTAMSEWLRNHGLTCKLVELEIFDYFNQSEARNVAHSKGESPYTIVFAGVLGKIKNGFLYALDTIPEVNFEFNIYGPGFDQAALTNHSVVKYKGIFPSSEIVSRIEGDFGLVWDGVSITECAGSFGEYLKINNPHKTSMYLRAGIPVIIWDKAAMAKYIQLNNAGIAVASLADIPSALKQLTPADYANMKANAENIAEKLGRGFYMSTALQKAVVA